MSYPEFPNHEDFTQISKILAGECEDEICVRGWIYRTRSSGKLAFIVLRDSTGKPYFKPSKKLIKTMDDLGISKSHVSLADEKNYAIAFAVLEK